MKLTARETKTRTLAATAVLEGAGIHSAAPCRVAIEGAPPGHGIVFRRGKDQVAADWRHARAELSERRTVLLGEDGARFEQIEHLMAALAAEQISDALVLVEGPEMPFLGGGAAEFQDAVRQAGVETTGDPLDPLVIDTPTSMEDGSALLAAAPHDGLRLSCFVEFPGTVVGNMGFSLDVTPDAFRQEAAAARTFALAGDLEKLRAAGLIKGGNLQNAVVFDHERYHNESLHFPNEVVRHKIIDLLGDLALLGRPLRGHMWAWRAGHRSHVRFAQHLAQEKGLPQ